MTDLYDLISADVDLRRTAGTHGGEFHGPCPLCGGKDRLAVWPNAERPGWWCRQCEKGGDAIQYLRERGYTYQDACRQLGVPLEDRRARPAVIAPPVACEPPDQAWRKAASAFVFWAQSQMTDAARTYLAGRGLTPQTVAKAQLGYNPTPCERSRSTWGLADENGRSTFWLPAGIVIPTYVAGVLWKIQIRRETVRDGQDRYKTVTGSSNAPLGIDNCTPGRPAMLVEGPFDCLAVQQTAGDLIGVAACGTSGARRVRWLSQLALCERVLISLDADEAGDSASRYWLNALPDSKRWRPAYADPAQMLEDGQDVRGWVLSGLDKTPRPLPLAGVAREYWRDEARMGSPALDRLRVICRERGYDYEATIGAISAD